MRLLLLSNSTMPGEPYLAWPRALIGDFLAGVRRAAFVPYAGVRISCDDYTARVREALGATGLEITGVHTASDPVRLVAESDAVLVGGGNTFRLLERLQAVGLLDAVRDRATAGAPYVGWSAGSNIACPTIRTTNDMPIIQPPRGFGALGLVSFQINAHYTDAALPNHGGETRPERIAELLELDRAATVVGLREGTGLRVEDGRVTLVGERPATVFRWGAEPREAAPGALTLP